MTVISIDEVKKLARLARIVIDDNQAKKFQTEIEAILEYVEQLSKIDTEGVEPTSQVTGLVNVTRPDELHDYGTNRDSLLANAPDQEGGYIKVKRVLE